MLFLTDEFNGKLCIILSQLQYFKENNDQYKSVHNKAKSVICNVYGSIFYVKESFEEITNMISDAMAAVSEQG